MPRERKAAVEAVARELMRQDGFTTANGVSLVDDAKAGSPRPAAWVRRAQALLKVVRAVDKAAT